MDINKMIDKLSEKGFRMTQARKDMLNLLSKKAMDIHELETKMKALGHPNVQTIYNNISFLERENAVFTTLDGQIKTYHLVDLEDGARTQVHVRCHANSEVFNVIEKKIMKTLKKELGITNFDINHLDITIQGECSQADDEICEDDKECMLKLMSKRFELVD